MTPNKEVEKATLAGEGGICPSIFADYELNLYDNQRVKVSVNDEYVTHVRVKDGCLTYILSDVIKGI